nr:immunoglobulin heavy chain junction region [Macaca mulatta]MOV88817.1 immunoglobulin heavy chain junction region [Macaca mulatta]MOV88827.1 immunoglobulin heavy chain junction region [Macaca mulatta]MOV88905.1 immunoglobulin heavy chain junction region [Macaca mulatta]MOV90270.1 immunoglobulin heavy chain junction region [Macaca mulatta]
CARVPSISIGFYYFDSW